MTLYGFTTVMYETRDWSRLRRLPYGRLRRGAGREADALKAALPNSLIDR
jgi:hypothetical protein